ncbi:MULTISPECIES: sulfate adenylyltransferase subunit CysN [unclassified Oleiphilus]|jgi:bifunctional enzyme CysN/CysC/sulfate adenylyltransferase subunit 1|uniref:sulfate adenylyltransferase subunit CysN n=4 Tax=Oleiphilus TaxID=141450 RepID=UPI0007C282C7|nr:MULTISPECIES: sulfate adenylyltransferase subunit CysN [unclassified Oleiphilus]KZY42642.1 sulfate adenylyltransferase subunit CysN [Oleiphilus sp. HI0050]KZY86326.1 sulfate adenylyltransferase subunit CysN [Oleiphilus sp. HI0069]KZY96089.1 sulfate adenylyltransferase subunit CysN [Oleiphilus sp. HI0072]KZZ10116.1 sulfate adenylyltransferase subunit CysN [Oleiphilus sp. HI0078]KZZ31700.1 sulfate adenylyltransferase subunit CysN [Oleiphilus sp. HI0085]
MSHQSDLISEDINEYLKQHEQKELLRLLTCGSVDDGKSTLIGRLLHDSQMIYEDQLEAIKKDSVKSGTNEGEIDLALLVDGLQAEREQGITIDVAYRYFSTAKRKFIIADTPGHEQYTRNMATGASTADLAIILIDARHGVLTQTKRHSFIASLLGIKHVIVAINKMDLVDYSEERFNEIKSDYLSFSDQLDLGDIQFAPLSALKGVNTISNSDKTPWYKGKPLMEMLESVEIAKDKNLEDFRLPVQYVNRPNLNFRGFCGTIASGIVKPGDKITALPSGKSSTVKEVVTFEGSLDEGFAGQAVTLTLNDEIDISRGDMIVQSDNHPTVSSAVKAHIVWMSEDKIQPGKLIDIKLGSKQASASIQSIEHLIDVNTLEKKDASELELNSIALCTIHANQTLAFDPYGENKATGAFIIIDRLTNVTVGAGMIVEAAEDTSAQWEPVSEAERAARLDHQVASIIACSGEAGDVLAQAAERKLFNQGRTCLLITSHMADNDADKLLIAKAAKEAGLIAITSLEGSSDIADTVLSATSDVDIPEQVKGLS